jgi:hypothetical protein
MSKKFPADEIVGQLYWQQYYAFEKWEFDRPTPSDAWDVVIANLRAARFAAEHVEQTGWFDHAQG